MGWASGSSLMRVIIEAVKLEVPDTATRQRIYESIIRVFDDADWDTHSEVEGIDDAFDAAMNETNKEVYQKVEIKQWKITFLRSGLENNSPVLRTSRAGRTAVDAIQQLRREVADVGKILSVDEDNDYC